MPDCPNVLQPGTRSELREEIRLFSGRVLNLADLKRHRFRHIEHPPAVRLVAGKIIW
jgi:hypothetical protein